MYEFIETAVTILFIICAASTIITVLVKRAKDKKENSKDDGNT